MEHVRLYDLAERYVDARLPQTLFGQVAVAAPYTIFDSKQIFDAQPLLFVTSTSGTGASVSHSANTASSTLTSGTDNGGYAIRQTRRYFNYQPGKAQRILITFCLNGQTADVTKRVGYFDANDGLFLEVTGSDVAFVRRTSTSGSPSDASRVVQANWNIDTLDGTGASQITLDTSKAQILAIEFEWLGIGTARLGFVIDGAVVWAHAFQHANVGTTVYMKTPNLPVRWEVRNTAAASSPSVSALCCTVESQGGYDLTGTSRTVGNGSTARTIATTVRAPILSIRLGSAYARASVVPSSMSVITTSNSAYRWELVVNPTYGAGSYSFSALTNSAVEYDVARTDAVTGQDYVIAAGYVTAQGREGKLDLGRAYAMAAAFDGTADVLSLVITNLSGGNGNYYGQLVWVEQ